MFMAFIVLLLYGQLMDKQVQSIENLGSNVKMASHLVFPEYNY